MSECKPARPSPLFLRVFRLYARWLFHRRFSRVWIGGGYRPAPGARTVYYLNHHSWWDGLIPLILNEYLFEQRGRALMEDVQMRRYPFFRWLGTFPVNRSEKRSAIRTLRFALDFMRSERAGLYLYPEGAITPPGTPMDFEGGLAWLYGRLGGEVDFVPVGIRIHTVRHDKPELHILPGPGVSPPRDRPRGEITARFEQALEEILAELRRTAGFDDEPYSPLF